jgi:glycosyltransferase involved in cell wall biosynthesis
VINGVTGLLTNEYDIPAMAEKILTLASSPELAARLGKAGQLHMKNNYDIKLRIALLDSIIQNSIDSNQN